MISNLKEAMFYEQINNNKVKCNLCNHRCSPIANYRRGICGVRKNIEGKLYSLVYGKAIACSVDPIEKKPLYHFKPRSKAFSIATAGCNFRCLNCQNWEISQAKPHEVRHYDFFPADVIKATQRAGSKSIAYTYSEAITFFEYMIDIARLAKDKGIYNLWISNGYINREPLLELCRVLDAAN